MIDEDEIVVFYAINKSVWDSYSGSEFAVSHGCNTSMPTACPPVAHLAKAIRLEKKKPKNPTDLMSLRTLRLS